MIKANELRIGNWVRLSGSDRWNKYSKYKNYQVVGEDFAESDIGGCNVDEFEPIQITPEILANCGFKPARKGVEWTIVTNEEFGSVMIVQCINGVYCLSSFPAEFLYIHQLQNLYYALTGKELNIQL